MDLATDVWTLTNQVQQLCTTQRRSITQSLGMRTRGGFRGGGGGGERGGGGEGREGKGGEGRGGATTNNALNLTTTSRVHCYNLLS